jgi:hypothetical protein
MGAAAKLCLPLLWAAMPPVATGHPAHSQGAGEAAGAGMRGAHLDTGCAEASQQRFDRGFYLLHNMDYTRARATFEQSAAADPACAMLSWGAAMTYFQPLWPGQPNDAALARGAQPPPPRARLHAARRIATTPPPCRRSTKARASTTTCA